MEARGGGRSDGAGSRSDDVSEMSDESEKSEKGGEEAELETEEGAEHVEGDEGLSRLLLEWRAREQARRLERGNAKRTQGKGRGKSNQEQGAPAARDIRSMFRVVKSECCREPCRARSVMYSSNNACLSMHGYLEASACSPGSFSVHQPWPAGFLTLSSPGAGARGGAHRCYEKRS